MRSRSASCSQANGVLSVSNFSSTLLQRNGGGNASIIVRNAEGDPNRLREFAREFARTEVDSILAIASASVRAAFETTRSVPIVALDLETDPVKAGMVGSLNRPGANITGVSSTPRKLQASGFNSLETCFPPSTWLACCMTSTLTMLR